MKIDFYSCYFSAVAKIGRRTEEFDSLNMPRGYIRKYRLVKGWGGGRRGVQGSPWEIFVPRGLLEPVSGYRSVEASWRLGPTSGFIPLGARTITKHETDVHSLSSFDVPRRPFLPFNSILLYIYISTFAYKCIEHDQLDTFPFSIRANNNFENNNFHFSL